MIEEIIKYDSDEAAQFVTGISGWVNRHGQFYGDNEHLARWSGATHKECEEEDCSTLIEVRGYVVCDSCRSKREEKRYLSLKERKWDECTPVYCQKHDEYFFDDLMVRDFLYENDLKPEDLRLILCQEIPWRHLDEEYFTDDMYEDCEAPTELINAIKNLNSVVAELNKRSTGIGYEPSKFRTQFNPSTK
jgi:hypothetical protein